jgi:aldose 1-epimerase
LADTVAWPDIVRMMVASIPPVAPSGDQHELSHDDQRVVVVEVGGGLRAYETAPGELLDGYELGEMCDGGRGQPLIPWPNRVRDGRYEFAGSGRQLALTEPESHNAIHGLVRWSNWTLAEHAPERVVVQHLLHPQPGWPTALHIQIEYSLGDDGLAVRTSATNVGNQPCPYGAGQHPYLTLGTESIDSLVLRAPGQTFLQSDDRGIPTGRQDVRGTRYDYTEPRELGGAVLDTGYTDLVRDPDRYSRVRIETDDGGRAATLWMDEAYGYLMLFTGDTLPAPKRRRGLAVEPMTCAPNALQSGDGLVVLEPGATHSASWGISPG